MLDFQQIKAQYPVELQSFERAILREYLQYKILQAVFESKQASKLTFLGGTSLRIIHGNHRFSEDIDLDNFGMGGSDFDDLITSVERFLTLEGFEIEITRVVKGAFHCYLRFPKILYEHGLSPHQSEKVLIQVDTVAQGYHYQPEVRLLNKFDVFTEVRVAPVDLLLAQKIFTAINRKRPKGRDFYDITFLFGITKPDFNYIHQMMHLDSAEELREAFLEKIREYDFEALAKDVAPFLIKRDQIKRVVKFREFWNQVSMD